MMPLNWLQSRALRWFAGRRSSATVEDLMCEDYFTRFEAAAAIDTLYRRGLIDRVSVRIVPPRFAYIISVEGREYLKDTDKNK